MSLLFINKTAGFRVLQVEVNSHFDIKVLVMI